MSVIEFAKYNQAWFLGNITLDIYGEIPGDWTHEFFAPFQTKSICFGGKAMNVAFHFAQLVGNSNYGGVVGTDFDKIGYRDYCLTHRINIEKALQLDTPTPVFQVIVCEKQKRILYPYVEIQPDLYSKIQKHYSDLIGKSENSIIYLTFESLDKYQNDLTFAKNRGCLIAWNPILVATELDMNLLDVVDILFINSTESKRLFPRSDLRHISKTTSTIIQVTDNENDVQAFINGKQFSVPTYPPKMIIDGTGAGDSFAACVLSEIFKSSCLNIPDSIKLANKYATKILENYGAQHL
jgi:sugar/nucleoside kinase (ribokinase family)